MKTIYASQLTATELGKRIRITLGTDTAVEDIIRGIEHELLGNEKNTFVQLANVPAPGALIPTMFMARNGWFKFSKTQRVEVAE